LQTSWWSATNHENHDCLDERWWFVAMSAVAIPKNDQALAPAKLTFIFEGPAEWPKGWTKQIYKRENAATKGCKDCCWITPEKLLNCGAPWKSRNF
jgi:hypothetical protein